MCCARDIPTVVCQNVCNDSLKPEAYYAKLLFQEIVPMESVFCEVNKQSLIHCCGNVSYAPLPSPVELSSV